ncbi:sensor domain-containing diguanylate cyclase [Lysobacter xanthus]
MLLLLMPLAQASSFLDRLREADGVRTAAPRRFAPLVADLQRDAAAGTPYEQRYLRLLVNHQRILSGEYGAAIGDSIALFDQAREPDVRYRAALQVANAAANTRDFTLGLRYLERALAMRNDVRDATIRSNGYGVAGVLYNQFGQFELGKHYADLWLDEAKDARSRCFARQLQVEALHGLGRPVDELGDIQGAISECVSANEPIATNLIRATLAQRWAQSGRVPQAIALLEAALPDVEATRYTRLAGEFHGLLAKFRLEGGDRAQAEVHANAVAGIKGQDPRWLPNVNAHEVLYRLAQDRGDYRTAFEEYRLYAEADRARLDDVKAREYAFQLSRHELNQKNQELSLVRSQNELLLLQQKAAKASAWNTRLTIALLLVLVASLAYWGWRARRTHGSLRTLADTDGLTGLSNRRHFRACSEAALALCAQRRRPASVLLFDLDHFKQINDQCGHSSGDWVLREVARVGRMHCREGDLFGRIGGEEFAMTMIDCDVDGALRIAEACRRAIAAIDPSMAGCALPVAASIGAVGTSQSGYDYEVLIAHADAAMYRSKVAGRNRVSLYEPPPVPQTGHPPLSLDRRNAEAMLKQY